MAGRGATTFQKRQKEQNRKEKREEKLAKRLESKADPTSRVNPLTAPLEPLDPEDGGPLIAPEIEE